MPGQTYNFKVADYGISRTGYQLKANNLRPAVRKRFFAYVPFGSCNSLLMLDFLIATRPTALSAELYNQLTESIRKELVGIADIPIIGHGPKRKADFLQGTQGNTNPRIADSFQELEHGGSTPKQSDFLLGMDGGETERAWDAALLEVTESKLNERSREGYIELDYTGKRIDASGFILIGGSEADRPIDWNLNIFRSVFLTKRISTVDLQKLEMKDLAFRVDQQDLLIDLKRDFGFRENTVATTIINERAEAIRTSTFDLRINTERILAQREIDWKAEILQTRSEAQRIINWEANIIQDRYEGRKFTDREANVLWKRSVGERLITRSTVTLADYILAQRESKPTFIGYPQIIANHGERKTWLANLVSAFRNDEHLTIIDDKFIVSRKGNAAYLFDPMIFADRLFDGESLLEWALIWAQKEKEAEMLSDFVGVKERLETLIESGVIFSSLEQTRNGLLVFDLGVAGRDRNEDSVLEELGDSEKNYKPTDVINVLTGDPSLRPSIVPANPFGYKDPMPSDNIESIPAAKPFRPSDVVKDYTGQPEAQPSIFNEDQVGQPEAQPSIFNEDQVGQFEAQPSIFNEDHTGQFEAQPSIFNEDYATTLKIRPSILGEEQVGNKEERPTHFVEGIEATDPLRPSDMLEDISMDKIRLQAFIDAAHKVGIRPNLLQATKDEQPLFAQDEPKPSFIGEEQLAGKEPKASLPDDVLVANEEPRPSHVGEDILGFEAPRPSDMVENILGFEAPRPSDMVEDKLAFVEERASHMGEEHLGTKEASPSHVEEVNLAELQERLAHLASGYLFGKHEDRASYLADMYYEAVRSPLHESVNDDSLLGFIRLVFNYGFIDEAMFAHEPAKAAALFENIVGHFDPFPSVLPEGIWAETEAQPSIIPSEIVAKKQPHYVAIVAGIVGSKEKAEAIVSEYLAAVRKLKSGMVNEVTTANERIKQAFLEKIQTTARGLIFDYNNDVLEEGMDPAEWTGGYGVPEDYDPHDPTNPYFPWVDDLNPLEMGQDDWVRFDGQPSDVWVRDRNQGLFTCQQEKEELTGFYRNDFTHDDYLFEVDFKVGDTAGDDAVGILFRYINAQNYYQFVVHGGDSDNSLGMNRPMQLYRMVGGLQTQMSAPMNPFTWEKDKWYKFQVSVLGSRIKLSVNGRIQYDFTD